MMDYRAVARHIAALDGGENIVLAKAGAFMVRCPAHPDGRPSLHVSRGTKTQPVILRCFARCEVKDIIAAANLIWDDVCAPIEEQREDIYEWTPAGPNTGVKVYEYTDEDGKVLFQVVRTRDKQFFQRTPDSSKPHGYRWNLNGTRRVIYHLADVLACGGEGVEVWIQEGEKDADRLRDEGECATCNPMGAGKWDDSYSEAFRGASVTIWSDADDVGRAHARQVRDSLMAHEVMRVRIVESAGVNLQGKPNKDASDHLDAGFTLDDVVVTVPYSKEQRTTAALEIEDYLAQQLPAQEFVIPESLAKGEVLILTGYEGKGKSTLLKQIGVQVAWGFHPFIPSVRIPCKRVLLIDWENKIADNHADFYRLRFLANSQGEATEHAPLYILEPGGLEMDVAQPAGLAWLMERVRAYEPDLLIMGPIYNMVPRDLRGEDEARPLKRAVNAVIEESGCAVILEHHVPHNNGQEAREVRPIGSSLLLRWPNFGFGLRPIERGDTVTGVSEFVRWRGPRRRNRKFPVAMREGNGVEWMWEPASPLDVQEAKQAIGQR